MTLYQALSGIHTIHLDFLASYTLLLIDKTYGIDLAFVFKPQASFFIIRINCLFTTKISLYILELRCISLKIKC